MIEYYKKTDSYNELSEYYFFKRYDDNIDVIIITSDKKNKISLSINTFKYDDKIFKKLLYKDLTKSTEYEYNHMLLSVQKHINNIKDEFNIF